MCLTGRAFQYSPTAFLLKQAATPPSHREHIPRASVVVPGRTGCGSEAKSKPSLVKARHLSPFPIAFRIALLPCRVPDVLQALTALGVREHTDAAGVYSYFY